MEVVHSFLKPEQHKSFRAVFVRPRSPTLSRARKKMLLESVGRVLSGVAAKEVQEFVLDDPMEAEFEDAESDNSEANDEGAIEESN